MIELIPRGDGVLLTIHVTPGAKRDAVGGEHAGALRVSTTKPADRGKANKHIVELVAKAVGIRRYQVELVSGHASRQKRLKIVGIDHAPLSRLVAALGDA